MEVGKERSVNRMLNGYSVRGRAQIDNDGNFRFNPEPWNDPKGDRNTKCGTVADIGKYALSENKTQWKITIGINKHTPELSTKTIEQIGAELYATAVLDIDEFITRCLAGASPR